MNYEADRAMNQKRLRMEAEPGHGVVQGNGLPLNYIDNGHQISYQPYAGAYNTHYPPDAFAAYGPPPPGGYAPQNLSYAPPAHQNYAHHQSFAQQPQQLHMQTHMGLPSLTVQGYADVVHKPTWPPQPHLLPPIESQKPLDVKQLKPEIKLEPTDVMKRPHGDEILGGDLDQPKIKIKTDIFKPDDVIPQRVEVDKPHEVIPNTLEAHKPELLSKVDVPPNLENKIGDKPIESTQPAILQPEVAVANTDQLQRPTEHATPDKNTEDRKPFSSPEGSRPGMSPRPGATPPGSEPKKRGRPKGSTNKPKPFPTAPTASPVRPPAPRPPQPAPRPRAPHYQYAVRPFRKDFSGIQFRRRWSDDCLDSSHIPNEVYFGDVPVSMEVLFNYYDANAERERLAAQAAHIAAQKAAAAKLAAAKLAARGIVTTEQRGKVTTVDSSSSEESDSDDSDSESEEETPKKGSKPSTPKTPGSGKRGRPPVPPELREPGITDMKKFCKAAGINFDYKKLVDGCTKNKERVGKMMDLLIAAGLEGKPTLDKCKALKAAKQQKKEQAKAAKKEAKVKVEKEKEENESETPSSRRMTRGATGVKPRQRIVISSDEEDDTPAARRTLSKLRSSVNDESDSD